MGLVFVVSGLEKLLSPYQNFLYVIQLYELGIPNLEEIVARGLPWTEFILGVFMVLGLWVPVVVRGLWILTLALLGVVAQAQVRDLPINECGCFGTLLNMPLMGSVAFDAALFLILTLLMFFMQKIAHLSMDRYFQRRI